MTRGTAVVTNGTRTQMSMSANSKTTNPRVRAYTHGGTARCMMDSGNVVRKKAMEFGREFMGTATLESGKTRKHGDMGCIYGKTGTSMRASGSTVLSMVMGRISSETVTPSKGNTGRACPRGSDSTNGKTGVTILGTLKRDKNMEKESGERMDYLNAINMKVNTNRIRNTDKEFLHGRAETCIRVGIMKMKEKVMEKCIGSMELHTKVNGTRAVSMDKVK